MQVGMRCGKCGKSTPLLEAYQDAKGIILKCKHCGVCLDIEKLRKRHFPEEVKDEQLELKLY